MSQAEVHRRSGRVYKQNRYQQLRGFYHVAVSGSFSAAARNMSLGQPAVTLQVQALERELRTKLLERRSGGVILTPEGQALFDLAAPLVEGLESLESTFHAKVGRIEVGQVVCAAPDAVVQDVLPALIGGFRARYPCIDVVIHTCPSTAGIAMVIRGDADLAVGAADPIPPNVSFLPLVDYDSYLVVPLGHALAGRSKVSLKEIVAYPFIAPPEDESLWRPFHREMEKHGLHPHIAVRVVNSDVRLSYVASGLGITITTGERHGSELAHRLVWISLAGQLPRMTYGLVTKRNALLSLSAKHFAEFIMDATPAFAALQGR